MQMRPAELAAIRAGEVLLQIWTCNGDTNQKWAGS
jgi:hypothetical protein